MEWRKNWFEYVRKVKRKSKCSHKEAMSLASQTWPQEKAKQQRKLERELKKKQRDEKVKKENESN